MERQGVRGAWDDVPRAVRQAVDDLVGATVVETRGVVGGFSPGPAVRARLDDGRAVFLKAADAEQHPVSAAMHRRERDVLAALPAIAPAPALLGCVDDGWVVLAVEWVEGRNPDATVAGDVDRLLDLLHLVADRSRGVEIDGVDTVARTHADIFGHWSRVAAEEPDGLDGWTRRHLDRLVAMERDAPEATAGDHLVHVDVRTDNVVLASAGADGDVLVDWPGAAIGAAWVDLVALLPALHLDGGPPPEEVLRATPLGSQAPPDAVDAFLVALAGYFTRGSLLPPPPGLPTLRPFQAAQGLIARQWISQRCDLL